MKIITKRVWELIDATDGKPLFSYYTLPVGEHEVEEISSPRGHVDNWYVLKGTKIGLRKKFLESYQNTPEINWDELEIIIID